MKKLLVTLLLGFSALTLGSTSALAKKLNTLFQVATYTALKQGAYDSNYTYRKLMKQGDFGVGTFQNINGDMIALHGRFYQITSSGNRSGRLKRVSPKQTAPFAEVIFFHPFRESNLMGTPSLSKLKKMIVKRLPNKNVPYAIEIDGRFKSLMISSLFKQNKPYRNLKVASKQQAVIHLNNVAGSLVGFWFPKQWEGIAPPGLYLNFINAIHTVGGHVLNVSVAHGELMSEPIYNVQIYLTPTGPFTNT